jgi:3',5'-nucleoside bisphosphate phosphatase
VALRRIKADLHVHTCLSPCAGLDMSPREVVAAAVRAGLDLIGVCDHNSAENVLAVKKAGERNGLMVLGGMEVSSSEEAHLLVFFDEDDELLRFQERIYRRLEGSNDEHAFGMQVIADDEDGVTGFCDRLLISATTLTAEELVAAAREARGASLVIAAHVDREAFSLIGRLGFIPPSMNLDALEISVRTTASEARKRFPDCSIYPLVAASDAHALEDIGARITRFTVADGSAAELRKALLGKDGRKAEC